MLVSNKIFQVLWNETALISQVTKIRQKCWNVNVKETHRNNWKIDSHPRFSKTLKINK